MCALVDPRTDRSFVQAHLDEAAELRLTRSADFAHLDSRPLVRRLARTRVLKSAGQLSPHSVRHTFATSPSTTPAYPLQDIRDAMDTPTPHHAAPHGHPPAPGPPRYVCLRSLAVSPTDRIVRRGLRRGGGGPHPPGVVNARVATGLCLKRAGVRKGQRVSMRVAPGLIARFTVDWVLTGALLIAVTTWAVSVVHDRPLSRGQLVTLPLLAFAVLVLVALVIVYVIA